MINTGAADIAELTQHRRRVIELSIAKSKLRTQRSDHIPPAGMPNPAADLFAVNSIASYDSIEDLARMSGGDPRNGQRQDVSQHAIPRFEAQRVTLARREQ
jgi:hypothetical protein